MASFIDDAKEKVRSAGIFDLDQKMNYHENKKGILCVLCELCVRKNVAQSSQRAQKRIGDLLYRFS